MNTEEYTNRITAKLLEQRNDINIIVEEIYNTGLLNGQKEAHEDIIKLFDELKIKLSGKE